MYPFPSVSYLCNLTSIVNQNKLNFYFAFYILLTENIVLFFYDAYAPFLSAFFTFFSPSSTALIYSFPRKHLNTRNVPESEANRSEMVTQDTWCSNIILRRYFDIIRRCARRRKTKIIIDSYLWPSRISKGGSSHFAAFFIKVS